MYDDSGVRLTKLQVDGGMANNRLFLEMLANIVGINVATPSLCETTALGAALAAGKARGIDIFKSRDNNEMKSTMSTYVPRIHGQGRIMPVAVLFIARLAFVSRARREVSRVEESSSEKLRSSRPAVECREQR